MINFETLSNEAQQENASEEAKSKLWKALFDLEHWYCIAVFQKEKSYPFNMMYKDNPFLMCFTDEKQAVSFAEEKALYPEHTEKPLMFIKSDEAVEYFAKFEPLGLAGVCFNHGASEFYCSFQELVALEKSTN